MHALTPALFVAHSLVFGQLSWLAFRNYAHAHLCYAHIYASRIVCYVNIAHARNAREVCHVRNVCRITDTKHLAVGWAAVEKPRCANMLIKIKALG